MKYLSIYLVVISFISILATMRDKRAAKKQRWRVKEKTLLCLAALGGSVAMFITMQLIRHKTKHMKFMIGIPIIIIIQVVAGWWFL